MEFKVDQSLYKNLLNKGAVAGTYAVGEQLLTDSEEYVKYDRGTLYASGRVDHDGEDAEVSMNTPYAHKQYYTGRGIQHGHGGSPGIMWFHRAVAAHKSDYDRIMTKAFAEGMK